MTEIKANYDATWKEAIASYFEEFLAFCFPTIYQGIDWSRGFKILTRDDVILLFRIIDKMMALSAELQQSFKQQVRTYQEERKMPFLSTIEEEAMEVGIERGIEQGLELGIERGIQQSLRDNIRVVLETRFPEVPSEITEALGNISDISRLQPLLIQAVTVNSLSDFQELLA